MTSVNRLSYGYLIRNERRTDKGLIEMRKDTKIKVTYITSAYRTVTVTGFFVDQEKGHLTFEIAIVGSGQARRQSRNVAISQVLSIKEF